MTELINISTNEQGASVVSARELYTFLGFDRSQWARWTKKNITGNQWATQGEDWVELDTISNDEEVFDIMSKTSQGGRPTTDYMLTLDFAKRLAMLARTDKGEEIRQYFIGCEKKLHGYDLRTLHTIDRYLTPVLTDQQRQINTLHDEVNRLVSLVEQVARKQPVGGSIPHQMNAGTPNGQIVPPATQNRAIIGIPPYRPAHPRTGVDLRTPSHVVEQYEHIQRLRRQGYKGAELASKAGLSKGQVSKIESRFRSISYRPAYCINLIVPSVRLDRHTCKD